MAHSSLIWNAGEFQPTPYTMPPGKKGAAGFAGRNIAFFALIFAEKCRKYDKYT